MYNSKSFLRKYPSCFNVPLTIPSGTHRAVAAIAATALCVELEGVEPSSKQGNHMLSTRLVIGRVFEHRQDRDRQPAPYPL